MSPPLSSACLLALLLLLSHSASAQDTDVRLAQIIEKITANEALYRNLEVITEKTYKQVQQNDNLKTGTPRSLKTLARTVWQHPYFLYEDDQSATKIEGDNWKGKSRYAFDGKRTRIQESSGQGSFVFDRFEPPQAFRPHAPLGSNSSIPFSVWLEGREKLYQHPNSKPYQHWEFRTTLLGEEKFKGLQCVKVRRESFMGNPPRLPRPPIVAVDVTLYWLATERNYLPVRVVGHSPQQSEDLAHHETDASDFREIRMGVWLPFRYVSVNYDLQSPRRNGQRVVSNTSELVITKADASPKHPLELFHDEPK